MSDTRHADLRAQVGAVRALHRPVDIEPSDTICAECSWQLPNGRYFGHVVEYPCPTMIALSPPTTERITHE